VHQGARQHHRHRRAVPSYARVGRPQRSPAVVRRPRRGCRVPGPARMQDRDGSRRGRPGRAPASGGGRASGAGPYGPAREKIRAVRRSIN
jgi:hypothetical protein